MAPGISCSILSASLAYVVAPVNASWRKTIVSSLYIVLKLVCKAGKMFFGCELLACILLKRHVENGLRRGCEEHAYSVF